MGEGRVDALEQGRTSRARVANVAQSDDRAPTVCDGLGHARTNVFGSNRYEGALALRALKTDVEATGRFLFLGQGPSM